MKRFNLSPVFRYTTLPLMVLLVIALLFLSFQLVRYVSEPAINAIKAALPYTGYSLISRH